VKRIAVITAVIASAAVLAILGTGASDDGGTYKVRAIFDNAVSVIPGEDVKIAGVKVGRIGALDVTPDKKAAITLDITEPGFQDFRTDATCTIRPQSLIGEKFVECTPTQPHPVGEPAAGPLPKIKSGKGKGEHLLPVAQNSSPVDIDLINDILRKPYAERLSIILGELGTAVAGRGKDLNETIKRANPALLETDKVLRILASQNRILANLATDSDTVLAPLARERRAVADQFAQSATVAQATAERGDDLERDFQKLPGFLRQLRPTMVRLGALSDQATPVLTDLGAQADNINSLVTQLGPFSNAARPAYRTLGQAAEIGGPALTKSDPTIKELGKFAVAAKPVAKNAALLLDSLQKTGGVERLMDYIFYQVAAVNGFDQYGHYLRAGLIVNLCSTYAISPAPGCSANFTGGSATASSRLTASQRDQLKASVAALAGNVPVTTGSRTAAAAPKSRAKPLGLPKIALPGRLEQILSQGTAKAEGVKTEAPKTQVQSPLGAPAASQAPDPRQGLLDYLLGSGS
jgi:phospholipid/cholesterol/gamma-HCH transport system substrate-binding protein